MSLIFTLILALIFLNLIMASVLFFIFCINLIKKLLPCKTEEVDSVEEDEIEELYQESARYDIQKFRQRMADMRNRNKALEDEEATIYDVKPSKDDLGYVAGVEQPIIRGE